MYRDDPLHCLDLDHDRIFNHYIHAISAIKIYFLVFNWQGHLPFK